MRLRLCGYVSVSASIRLRFCIYVKGYASLCLRLCICVLVNTFLHLYLRLCLSTCCVSQFEINNLTIFACNTNYSVLISAVLLYNQLGFCRNLTNGSFGTKLFQKKSFELTANFGRIRNEATRKILGSLDRPQRTRTLIMRQ